MKVKFYNLGMVHDESLKFSVIVAKYKGKWVFVQHKERTTWEFPGGHREVNESIVDSAKRELYEECGAIGYDIIPICIYSVVRGDSESYGQLFYADIYSMGELPDSEMAEVEFFDELPNDLTHPLIYPTIFKKVIEQLKK